MPLKVFISYSHRDDTLVELIHEHLAQLRNDGIIESWWDRAIEAGQAWENEISRELETADVILLLVSASFLNSRYAYSIEGRRAMELHESRQAIVIPVILRECDWHTAPFATLQAATRNARPIASFADPHEGAAEVARAVRRAASRTVATTAGARDSALPRASRPQQDAAAPSGSLGRPRTQPGSGARDLRVRRDVTDLDRLRFLQNAMRTIIDHFQALSAEAMDQNQGLDIDVRVQGGDVLSAEAFLSGRSGSAIEIWLDRNDRSAGQISFSTNIGSRHRGSSNGWLALHEEDGRLSLRGMMMLLSGEERTVDEAGAAELLWEKFFERLR